MSDSATLPAMDEPHTGLLSYRELGAALLVLLLGAAVCFHPLVLAPTSLLVGPQNLGENDLTKCFLGIRDFPARQTASQKVPPFWNPYSLAGQPILGNPQSGVCYPPNWLFLVFPTLSVISWMLIAHHVWGGLGTFVACRAFGFRWRAAVMGGLIFQAAPYFVAQLGEGHYPQVCVASWLPWGLWAYDRLRTAPLGNLWRMVVVLAAGFFCGHVQELYYLTLILSAFWITDLVQLFRAGRKADAKRLLWAWGFVGLFTWGAVAIELLPILDYSKHSVREGGMSWREVGGIDLRNLTELVYPFANGGPTEREMPLLYWESVCYFGVAPLLLALIGTIWGRHLYPVRRISIAALAGLLFAFGANNPLFPLIFTLVPKLNSFREPARIFFFVSLCVAILAAAAIEQFLRWRTSRGFSENTFAKMFPIVAAVVCVVELAIHASFVLRTVPSENIRGENPIADFLGEHAGHSRVLARQELLSDWEAWSHGIFKAQSYEPVPPLRYVFAFDALTRVPRPHVGRFLLGFNFGSDDASLRHVEPSFANMMGIRYLVTRQQPLPENSSWKIVAHGKIPAPFRIAGETPPQLDYQIVENPDAFPRAFVVGRGKKYEIDLRKPISVATTSLRKQVLLEANDALTGDDRADFAPAEIVSYSSRQVIIDSETNAPGYLVLTDQFASGWRATVDGQPTPILLANLAFRAVALPPGKHRVEFLYTPPRLRLGAIITCATWLLIVAWQWMQWRNNVRREVTT